ncbi:MAG TPA: hypothetical protein VGN16_09990 [Acidobacteriaceae bacterium]
MTDFNRDRGAGSPASLSTRCGTLTVPNCSVWGVSLPTVSKRLGHTNVHVAATVYSHALPHDEVAAAQIWDKAMSGSVEAAPAQPARETKARRAVVSIASGRKTA